jgi:hypothetical protein
MRSSERCAISPPLPGGRSSGLIGVSRIERRTDATGLLAEDGVRRPADQLGDERLRHAGVHPVVRHVVAAVGGEAERQLGQVAGAEVDGPLARAAAKSTNLRAQACTFSKVTPSRAARGRGRHGAEDLRSRCRVMSASRKRHARDPALSHGARVSASSRYVRTLTSEARAA